MTRKAESELRTILTVSLTNEPADSKSLVENAFSVQFSSELILPLPDSLQTDQNVADTEMHQHLGDSCRPSEHRNEKLTALRLACPAAGTTHI